MPLRQNNVLIRITLQVMKKLFVLAVVGAVGATALTGFRASDQGERKQLREMLVQLGYEVNDLDTTAGKEKFSFKLERGGLNIPVAAEISPNGKFIWLTVFCKQDPPADKGLTLFKQNAEIQPSQFYITKSNKLMVGLAIENHESTNASLRDRTEKIVNDVVKTKDDWQ